MARIYKPVGPSSDKAATPTVEIKKPSEKSQKEQKEANGQ